MIISVLFQIFLPLLNLRLSSSSGPLILEFEIIKACFIAMLHVEVTLFINFVVEFNFVIVVIVINFLVFIIGIITGDSLRV